MPYQEERSIVNHMAQGQVQAHVISNLMQFIPRSVNPSLQAAIQMGFPPQGPFQ